MSVIVGKIKITEDRITTTKGEVVEIWTRWGNGDENKFITYNGNRYKLLKSKESTVEDLDSDIEESLDIEDFDNQ